jgi:hypothetical protein
VFGVSAIGVALLAVVIAAGPANAAPKVKPTPTPTVTATSTSTPAPTTTADPSAVQLSCAVSGEYVVADYTAGVLYGDAVLSDGPGLDGTLNVLATFGGGTHTKFLKSMLPQGTIVKVDMVTTDGSIVASCDVNTGYSNPYS